MMKVLTACLTVFILLAGCGGGDGGKQESKNGSNSASGAETSIQTTTYFPKAQQIKTYKGSGNEFASEVETAFTREGNYLATVSDNGGTRILRIFQLDNKGISIVYEEPEYYDEDAPDIGSLKQAFRPKVILPNPVTLNQRFDDWIVKMVDAAVAVPYGKINKVIVLEKTGEDGSTIQNYWAPGLGIVKKSFYLKDDSGNETVVTTELEKVEAAD
ncbi:hypothetical protein [Neobacillus notoginsengisoli]|nr:hypothetical protein [Neobacillus notoginsengisoli]